MGNAKNNLPPSAAQMKKLLGIIGRDYGELSESMKNTAREIMTKFIDFEPGKPSSTILSEMILTYCYELYGKTKVSKGNESPLQLENGNMAELESIRMLSNADGVEYTKNNKLFENRWFRGRPDIIITNKLGEPIKVIDVKTSYDLPSFIMNKYKPESTHNILELMGYMDLLGCSEGEIVHCLPDMPTKIVEFEKKRLQERYKTLELDQSEIDFRLEEKILNMEYSSIPNELKIFRRKFTKNAYTLKSVKSRVTASKKWMKQIHENFVGDSVFLNENIEDNQENNV